MVKVNTFTPGATTSTPEKICIRDLFFCLEKNILFSNIVREENFIFVTTDKGY